jgi:hypothetical protein
MEYYLAINKNEIMLFAGKSMEHHVFPHMKKLDLKDKCIHKYTYDLIYIYSYI